MKEKVNKTNNEYEELLIQADKLFVDDKLTNALNVLEGIPEDCPEYGESLFMKSMIVGCQGDKQKSFKLFQKFLAETFGEENVDLEEEYRPINMNDPEEVFQCGVSDYFVFEDYENAIRNFNRSLKLKPDQSKVLHLKALAYANLGKLKKAIKIIDKAIKIEQDNFKYWNDRGVFFSELNFISKAHKSFDKSIQIKSNPIAWSNKGILYFKNNEFDNALKCLDEAIKLDSDYSDPIIVKAMIYSHLKDYKKADEFFEMAENIDDGDSVFLVEKAKHLLNQNKFHEALAYFDRCLELDDEWAEIWMFKSMALSELAQDEESEKCFKKAIDLDPDSISVFDEVLVIED